MRRSHSQILASSCVLTNSKLQFILGGANTILFNVKTRFKYQENEEILRS